MLLLFIIIDGNKQIKYTLPYHARVSLNHMYITSTATKARVLSKITR